MTNNQKITLLATFDQRISAAAFDYLLFLLSVVVFGILNTTSYRQYGEIFFYLSIILYLNAILGDSIKGQSIGKRVFKIKVIDALTLQAIGFKKTLKRFFIINFNTLPWNYLSVENLQKKDKESGTVVISSK